MKKVLLFIDSLGAGGAQRQLVGLASMLKAEGYDVVVLTYFDYSFYKPVLDEKGIENICVNEAISHIKRIPLIDRAIKRINPDVVISYIETPSNVCCVLKLLGRKWKLIVSERNTSQQNGCQERIRFNLFRVADYVVPNSYSQQKFINDNYPKLEPKLRTITNFVDLDLFKREKEHQFKGGIIQIMIAASVWPPKNTLGFIEAVKKASERSDKFHVKWYGLSNEAVGYAEKCNRLINELNIGKYIELLDKTTEIKDCYCHSDYFCLPSYYEGTPNVICEAISCGLPVICSDVCDNGIYVKEGVNGFLFDPNSHEGMAEKLLKIINLNQEQYNQFSAESRKTAEGLLSKEVFLNKYIDLIES